MGKLLSGVYTLEKKWELYWLKNKLSNNEEAMQLAKLQSFLIQSFDGYKIKKITDALDENNKVLIDFDKNIAKLIVKKEEPFINAILPFFRKSTVQDWFENGFEEIIE